MSDLRIDALEMAKDFQWELSMIEDPVEAALRGQEACLTLRGISDERLRQGRELVVRSMGAYMLHQWDEDEQRHVSMQYAEIVATGNSGGVIGFIQHMGRPYLQTLFFPVREARVHPKPELRDEDGAPFERPLNAVPIPSLLIPVLDIEEVKVAA